MLTLNHFNVQSVYDHLSWAIFSTVAESSETNDLVKLVGKKHFSQMSFRENVAAPSNLFQTVIKESFFLVSSPRNRTGLDNTTAIIKEYNNDHDDYNSKDHDNGDGDGYDNDKAVKCDSERKFFRHSGRPKQ